MDRDMMASFGELLQSLRKRKGVTQQQLAVKLGMHRNTIGSWERGDYLPDGRSTVLELAKQLRLNDLETRRLLEASLTSLAPYWSVPILRNPFFTGREELLDQLYTHLAVEQAGSLAQSCALYGLGGIGKTQVAVEYAYRHALEYSAVFWLAAETAESLITSLQQIANHLQLAECQAKEQPQMVKAVQHWLATHSRWLLIADNAEDLDLFQTMVPAPSARQGALLFTTRRQALGILAEPLEVPPMSSEEGITLIQRRARLPGARNPDQPRREEKRPQDASAASKLVWLLEGLPLALDQAGAYIEETGCTIEEYVQRYHNQRRQILARRGIHGGTHPASVAATLELSVEQVEQRCQAAADLLRLCAFLHSESIPEELLIAGASHLGPILGPVVADPYQFDLALAALRNVSLLIRQPETRTLSIHRLVQTVIRDQMQPAEVRLWGARAVRAINAAFPEPEFSAWAQCERSIPHALACIPLIEVLGGDLPEMGELLFKAGDYLVRRGQYAQAEALFRQALHIQEQFLGPDHPQIAISLYHLAFIVREQGKYEQAEGLFYQALAIHERALEPDYPAMATTLTGLATLYRNQGKYELAEPLYQRALQIWEQIPGSENPEMGCSLSGLAILRKDQGRYEQAELLYERALRLREGVLGLEHPLVAMSLNNLATIYQEQKQYELATVLYQRARQIWEQLEHPDLAYALSNLGEIYREQERHEQAEAFSQQALNIWEQALGPEHFLLSYPLNNLAEIAQAQGKMDHAESLFKRALQIREHQLGADHPETTTTRTALATLYRNQGKYELAESFSRRAGALTKKRGQ